MISSTFGIRISMRSNLYKCISLAAITHVGAMIANLKCNSDVHYPWLKDEAVEGGKLAIRGWHGRDAERSRAWLTP